MLSFNVVLHEEEDGGYSVSVPALPGCFSQGDTFEEAMKNAQEAIELHLENEPKDEFELAVKQREFMVPIKVGV